MDKPNRGNVIKIKLNGENQLFQEEKIKKGEESSGDSFSRVIKIDPAYKEQDGFFETAAAHDSVDESFDWVIPESVEDDIEEYQVVSNKKGKKSFSTPTKNTKKRNHRVVRSIIFTAIFAILIGTSFGVIMLKLFNTDQSQPAVATPVDNGQEPTKGKGEATGKTASVILKAENVYVVQGGAFSTKEAAKDGAKLATDKGVPAQTLEMGGKEYIFLGVADSIDTAKQLGIYYKTNGISEVFAKQIVIGEKTITDINNSEKSFLEASADVYHQLSNVTSNALVTSSISNETIKAVSGLSDQMNLTENKLKNEKVKNLHLDLATAVEKVKAFQKSKDEKNLLEAQQHLLNFLVSYYLFG